METMPSATLLICSTHCTSIFWDEAQPLASRPVSANKWSYIQQTNLTQTSSNFALAVEGGWLKIYNILMHLFQLQKWFQDALCSWLYLCGPLLKQFLCQFLINMLVPNSWLIAYNLCEPLQKTLPKVRLILINLLFDLISWFILDYCTAEK